jgi:hypothetical protein
VPVGITLIAVAAVSTGMQATAQHKAGQQAEAAGAAQQDVANSQADLLDYNAHNSDLQAADAVERGEETASRLALQVKSTIGRQRTGLAANNVDVGYGSAVDVQADAAYLGSLDESTARLNASRAAWGYSVQAEDQRRGAAIARKGGVNAAAAGQAAASASNWQVAGTLLGGTTSLLSQKYGFGGGGESVTTLSSAPGPTGRG